MNQSRREDAEREPGPRVSCAKPTGGIRSMTLRRRRVDRVPKQPDWTAMSREVDNVKKDIADVKEMVMSLLERLLESGSDRQPMSWQFSESLNGVSQPRNEVRANTLRRTSRGHTPVIAGRG